VAEGLNRTVNIVLNAVTDAYNRSIAEAQKVTDTAVNSIQTSAANATKSFDALSVSVKTSNLANVETTQSMSALNAALNASNTQLAATSANAAAAAESTKKVAESAAATAAAETKAAGATSQATEAFKASTWAATEAAAKTAAVGQAAQTAGAALENTAKQSSSAGGFLSSLGSVATRLVPSLGSIATLAAGAATGFAGLQIVEKVGGWLLDTGVKALSTSEAMKGLNATLSGVKSAFSEAAGKGVEALAQAFNVLLGPAIQKLSGWVMEALKWVTAFGQWFLQSGILQSAAQKLFGVLNEGFQHVKAFIGGVLEGIAKGLGLVDTSLDNNAKAGDLWQKNWNAALSNMIHSISLFAAVAEVLFKKLAELSTQYGQMIVENTRRELNTIKDVWDKIASKLPDSMKQGFALLQMSAEYFRNHITAEAKEIGTALNDNVNSPFKGMGDAIAETTKRNEVFIQQVIEQIKAFKLLGDNTRDQTNNLNALGAAAENTAKKFNMQGVYDAQKQHAAEMAAQAQKINDSVAALIPTYKEADAVTIALAKDQMAGAEKVIQATESIKFATDKQIDDMIYNVREGWKQQVSMAGTSTEEIKGINQAAWDSITQTISKDWFKLSKDQQQALAELGAQVRKSADEHGQILTKGTKETATALEQRDSMWKDAQRNITRLVRQTASDITDALWTGDKSFGELTKSMLESIGKMFTQIFVQQGVQAVQKFIGSLIGGNGLTAALGEVTKAFKGIGDLFGGLGGGAQTAAKAGGAAGGAAGGGGGALGGLGGAFSAITGAVSAVTGIIGIFQTRGTQKIEENIQQGVFMTYMAVHDLYVEFQAYTQNQVVGLRGDITHWGSQLWDQLSRGFNNMRTGFADISGQLAALAGAFNVQSLTDAIRGIQLAPSTGVPVDVSSFSVDFSPVVTVLNDIRAALTASALRPNVTMHVQVGPTTEQVSQDIVHALQMAGIVR
jgi:hypothetical protein